MPEPGKLRLAVHPLIASLTSGGKEPEPAVQFAGYIGESGQAGTVRLYLTLNDLSQYLEFEESAILQTGDAPENMLPNKGLLVWVRANSPVRACRMQVHVNDAQVIASAIAGNRRRPGGAYGRRLPTMG
jgi:hypothetical protein